MVHGRELPLAWGGWFPIPGLVLLIACIAFAGVHWRSGPKEVGIGAGVAGLWCASITGSTSRSTILKALYQVGTTRCPPWPTSIWRSSCDTRALDSIRWKTSSRRSGWWDRVADVRNSPRAPLRGVPPAASARRGRSRSHPVRRPMCVWESVAPIDRAPERTRASDQAPTSAGLPHALSLRCNPRWRKHPTFRRSLRPRARRSDSDCPFASRRVRRSTGSARRSPPTVTSHRGPGRLDESAFDLLPSTRRHLDRVSLPDAQPELIERRDRRRRPAGIR